MANNLDDLLPKAGDYMKKLALAEPKRHPRKRRKSRQPRLKNRH